MKLLVMIPAYNEESTVGFVIEETPRKMEGIDSVEILLIDDGSTDSTVREAQKAGVDFILRHKRNMGLGVAFKNGLNRALAMGEDIIVSIDADMQYSPSEISPLIQPILEGKADIVLGNRQVSFLEHMPTSKKIGNKIASWVTRRASGLSISDAQTGFRAFSRKAASKMNLNSSHTYVHECLVQAGAKNLRVTEVPVAFRERKGKSRLISSVWGYAISSGKTLIKVYAQYHPLKAVTLIGLTMALIGTALASGFLVGFFEIGKASPYLPIAGSASILLVVSLQAIIFGMLAEKVRKKSRRRRSVT
ncbi:MAG: glycosyltransferase family 2 protein [Thermoplasmata archaeon]